MLLAPPVWAGLLGVGAFLAWRRSGASRVGVTPGRGSWTGAPGQTFPGRVQSFLGALAAATGLHLYATSGWRGPEAQARAWQTKIRQGYGLADFLRLYKRDDLVREVWAAGGGGVPSQAAMARVFSAQVARGDLITSHMASGAVDLRTTGGGIGAPGQLTPGEVALVVAAAKKLGARVVHESRPPHLHLEIP